MMANKKIIDIIKRVVHNRNTTGAYPPGDEYWDIKVDDKIYRVEFIDPTLLGIYDKEDLEDGDPIGTFEYNQEVEDGLYDGEVKIPDLREICAVYGETV